MKIVNHILQLTNSNPVLFKPTPNKSGKYRPEYLIMHYTASSSFDSAVSWLTNKAAKASAHLIIGKDSKICQLAPFNMVTWHAGISFWNGLDGMNKFSVGIELVNCGRLARSVSGYYCPLDRKVIPNAEVTLALHKNESKESAWESYSEVQLNIATEVSALIYDHYKLKDVIGHDDVSPFRKSDPGPAFPMSSFRSKIAGRKGLDSDTHATTTVLNIRSGPGAGFDLISDPLPKGTKVHVIKTNGNWSFVLAADRDLEGWVSSRFLAK